MRLADSMSTLRALSDPTRVRLLAVLEGEELTVAELQRVLEMPQSRVSTHLARLKEAGFAVDRTDGPQRYYRIADSMAPPLKAAWSALREPLDDDPQLARDRARRDAQVAARSGTSWVDRVAGSLDRHYSPGRTWEAMARGLALLPHLGDVADLGAGDGAIAELLAPNARHIIGIDKSERMITAGRERLRRANLHHVELRQGDMQAVPLDDASVDFVLLQQTLQYADDPARVFAEAARILRPGGRALCVTLAAHDHEVVRRDYGHIHLGFEPAELRRLCEAAPLEVISLTSAGRERRPPQFEALALLAGKQPAKV